MPGHPVRLWLPRGERPDHGLYVVGGFSAEQSLYLTLEGSALPPPRTKEEDMHRHVPMLALKVCTESGVELPGKPNDLLNWRGAIPHEQTEPLIVRLHDEDGSVIWETVIAPE